ncbi:MAG: hypothetical protein VX733_14095 [Candidatus Latescibacterota bacterium]|nr:hypothetical protein [Candidatus Latescibacterota bacterium]
MVRFNELQRQANKLDGLIAGEGLETSGLDRVSISVTTPAADKPLIRRLESPRDVPAALERGCKVREDVRMLHRSGTPLHESLGTLGSRNEPSYQRAGCADARAGHAKQYGGLLSRIGLRVDLIACPSSRRYGSSDGPVRCSVYISVPY